jgi:hypothetical protein
MVIIFWVDMNARRISFSFVGRLLNAIIRRGNKVIQRHRYAYDDFPDLSKVR